MAFAAAAAARLAAGARAAAARARTAASQRSVAKPDPEKKNKSKLGGAVGIGATAAGLGFLVLGGDEIFQASEAVVGETVDLLSKLDDVALGFLKQSPEILEFIRNVLILLFDIVAFLIEVLIKLLVIADWAIIFVPLGLVLFVMIKFTQVI
jgi:hypothetical protein